MQSIATTTHDVEDREISAAEIHGVHPQWAYGGGARRGTEGAFRLRLPKHHSGFARPKAGGPRRSAVSKGLRGGWHEPGELSGIRPRVDGQRKRLGNDGVVLLQFRFDGGRRAIVRADQSQPGKVIESCSRPKATASILLLAQSLRDFRQARCQAAPQVMSSLETRG